jgi:hypothetical protein
MELRNVQTDLMKNGARKVNYKICLNFNETSVIL